MRPVARAYDRGHEEVARHGTAPYQVALTPDEGRLLVLHTGTYDDDKSASLSINKL